MMSFQTTLLLAASAIALVGCGQIQPSSKPAVPVVPVVAEPYEGIKFDGTYVGTVVATNGGCLDGHREMVIVVKRSHASVVWNYRDGYMLLGDVSPDGAVDMHSQHETFLLDLKGRIDGDTLTATTSSTSSHGDCSYAMTMTKRDLAKAQ